MYWLWLCWWKLNVIPCSFSCRSQSLQVLSDLLCLATCYQASRPWEGKKIKNKSYIKHKTLHPIQAHNKKTEALHFLFMWTVKSYCSLRVLLGKTALQNHKCVKVLQCSAALDQMQWGMKEAESWESRIYVFLKFPFTATFNSELMGTQRAQFSTTAMVWTFHCLSCAQNWVFRIILATISLKKTAILWLLYSFKVNKCGTVQCRETDYPYSSRRYFQSTASMMEINWKKPQQKQKTTKDKRNAGRETKWYTKRNANAVILRQPDPLSLSFENKQ